MNDSKIYSNGLKLVVGNMPSIRSVSVGIWVGVGSARENESINGLSHFTEHMMFKGTEKMTPFDIANAFESLGASVNAFTGKENTCYYVKSIDEYSEKCFAILTDIFFNSTFHPDELDKERQVIIEEINMVEDSPEEICYDLLANAVYGKSKLGQTIIGNAKNVKKFSSNNVVDFLNEYYLPDNVVVSFAGNITLEEADKLVQKYMLPFFAVKNSNLQPLEKFNIEYGFCQRIKDFEQSNIAISYPSLSFNDTKYTTQSVLNVILGGGMSSRLFQTIREQMGLAYSVYSSPSAYCNNGLFNILLNISANNTEKALGAVKSEIVKLLKEGIDKNEFERAKAQMKSVLVFAQENVQSVMSSLGKFMLVAGEMFDVNKKLAEIDKVTIKGLNDFANELFDSTKSCLAYVGKDPKLNIAQYYRS